MSQEKIEKLFKWVDFIKIVLSIVVGGAIAVAVWSTKIQMTVNSIEGQINDMQHNSTMHRDALKDKEKEAEHRFTGLEHDIEWLKRARDK